LWEPKLGGFFEFNPTWRLNFNTHLVEFWLCRGVLQRQVLWVACRDGWQSIFQSSRRRQMLGSISRGLENRRNLSLSLGMRWDKDFNLIGSSAQGLNRTYLALKAIGHPAARSLP